MHQNNCGLVHNVNDMCEAGNFSPPPREGVAIRISCSPIDTGSDTAAIRQFLCSSRSNRIIVNVGGEKNEILRKSIEKKPGTRLADLFQCQNRQQLLGVCDDYNLSKREFFFDRHPKAFMLVLDWHRLDEFHLVDGICAVQLVRELEYWKVNRNEMARCCFNKFTLNYSQQIDEMAKDNNILSEPTDEDEVFTGKFVSMRKQVWDTFEKPQYSRKAQAITIISIFFIVVATVCLTLSTLPSLQVYSSEGEVEAEKTYTTPNNTNGAAAEEKPPPVFDYLETICIAWFTVEYVLRLWSSPDKCRFLKGALNIIDVIAIVPFYASLVLIEVMGKNFAQSLVSVRKTVQIFRILRVLRILKLARHSTGLQALGYTLKMSYKELGLLAMFLALGVLLFSSLVYFAEKDDNPVMFPSIPYAFWWSVITMTTVGYGDLRPITVPGKLIGACCCICGVLVVALPIPIIVNNFAEYYKQQTQQEKTKRRIEFEREARQQREQATVRGQDHLQSTPAASTLSIGNRLFRSMVSLVSHRQMDNITSASTPERQHCLRRISPAPITANNTAARCQSPSKLIDVAYIDADGESSLSAINSPAKFATSVI